MVLRYSNNSAQGGLAEAPSFGQPIVMYDVLSAGAQAYLALARELLGRRGADAPAHRRALLANCLAQAQALLEGTDAGLEAHRACPGGRPSTTVLLRRIDAYTLGALLALYEHRIFVQSVLWDINPFDQWGVELGKKLAGGLEQALQGDETAGLRLDASTRALAARVRDWQR